MKLQEWFDFRTRLISACEKNFCPYAEMAKDEGESIPGDTETGYSVDEFEEGTADEPPTAVLSTFVYGSMEYCHMPLSLVLDEEGNIIEGSSYNILAFEEARTALIRKRKQREAREEEKERFALSQKEQEEKAQLKRLIEKYGVTHE